jgi:Zn-dependent peptidase ImmA (M78 family)
VDLRYYKHRKVMGTYQQRSKLITVYWGSHADLREVVNTVIHEYQHFLDIRSGKDDRAYDKEIKEVGYQDNSFERKAREVANRWQKACFKDLEKRGACRIVSK